MSGPANDFMLAAESGDPQAFLANQTDSELRSLIVHTKHLLRANLAKGGFPRDLLALCCIEATNRFTKPPTPKA